MITVQEAAAALGVSPEAVKKHIRELYPELMRNGLTTYLNEAQITAIKRKMLPATSVAGCVYPRTIKRRPTRLYQIWLDMKQRCYNSRIARWKYYGGKGISVCDEWHEFDSFAFWALQHGYNADLTIDRIDSNKNYAPVNCQWITRSENTIKAHLGTKHSVLTKNLLSRAKTGEKNPAAKPCMCVETGCIYSTAVEAGKSLGFTGSAITNVLKGRQKTAGGYTWVYA
jgi:hypothetical protein